MSRNKECKKSASSSAFKLWTWLGLALFYIFYIYVMGGVVFSHIEVPRDHQLNCTMSEWWNVKRTNESDKEICFQLHFTNFIFCLTERSINCSRWNVFNSAYNAFLIVATIGHGHEPRTAAGKLYFLLYASFGIPLTLYLVALVADNMKRLKKLICQWLNKGNNDWRLEWLELLMCILAFFGLFVLIPAWIFTSLMDNDLFQYETGGKEWTYIDGVFYTFTTLTTIGYGPNEGPSLTSPYFISYLISRGDKPYEDFYVSPTITVIVQVATMVWILHGLAFLYMLFNYGSWYYQYLRNKYCMKASKDLEDPKDQHAQHQPHQSQTNSSASATKQPEPSKDKMPAEGRWPPPLDFNLID